MTYSRPSTNTVDAFGDPGLPGAIQVQGTSRVEVSKNGRLFDNRNPEQIGRNVELKNAAINNFIGTITDVAPKVIKGVLQEQANQQIGDLLASQSPEDLMRSTTAGPQRDAIRALNPFARDKLEELKGVFGANKYTEVYTAENEKNKAILTNPDIAPEVKAQTRGDMKSTAMELSKLSGVAPRVLAAVAPGLAEFEGRMAGKNYRDTNTTKRNQDLIVLENGVTSVLAPFLLREQKDMSGIAPWLTKEIADQSAMFTPNELADGLYSGIQTQVQQLIAEGSTDQAMDLARGALALANAGVKAPSGTSFFDLKDSQGKSLLFKLSTLSRVAEKANQAAGEITVKKLGGEFAINYQIAQTAEEKDAAYTSYLGQIATLSPENQLEAFALAGRAKAILDRPSQLQIQNAAQLMLNITTKDLNKKDAEAKLLEAVNVESITSTQFSELLGQVAQGNPDRALYEGIDLGSKATQPEFDVATSDLINAGDIEPNGPGTSALAGFTTEGKREYVENLLRQQVTAKLERVAKEARDDGNPWTPQMYVDNYREELQRQATTLKEKLSQGFSNGTSRLERINKEYTNLIDSVKSGPLTIKSFDPETIKRYKEQSGNKNPTVKDLLGELGSQLDLLTDSKGEKIYPDATKEMKELARQSKENEGESGFWEKANPLNLLQELYPTPDQSSDSKEEKTSQETEADKKDPAKGFFKVLGQGLNYLGGALPAAPAKAGTLEGKPGVINTPNSPEFAKVMARQIPLSIKTQALPQLAAATPVRRVTIAISNRNHPFFVAIGIAEGTRTPSGANTKAYYGHTDPGDGNRNRGTVSGGRNGGSPQQVDRQWMGILSGVSATVSPVLQRLGLPANSAGWNRVMFNVLDLRVQAPGALQDFIGRLPDVIRQGVTIEAIAKARADSFVNPRTGRLEASGFGNNYSRLFADQRSRAGAFDYKRRF